MARCRPLKSSSLLQWLVVPGKRFLPSGGEPNDGVFEGIGASFGGVESSSMSGTVVADLPVSGSRDRLSASGTAPTGSSAGNWGLSA
jgi:hypothetical protein